MTRVLKYTVLTALFMAAQYLFGQKAFAEDSLKILALEGRIDNLDLMRDNLSHELALHKQDLGQEVGALENQSIVLFILTSAIAGFGTITILISFWKGIEKAKQLLLSQAEGMLEEEVKKRLPELTEQKLKAMIAAEMEPFLKVAKKQREADGNKARLSILVVGADDPSIAEGARILSGLGFDHVKGHVADGNDLPPSQVYFFHLYGHEQDEARIHLKDGTLNKYIDKDPNSTSAFFFYTNNHILSLEYKSKHKFVGYANRESTLEPRLMELLSSYNPTPTP